MIEIDRPMPENCYLCDCNSGEYSPDEYEKRYCRLTGRSFNLKDYKKRPDWCPLKEGHKHLYGNFAEWERFEGNNVKPIWRCSECEVSLGDYECETDPKVMGYNYCPNCGARMDEK